MVTIQAPGEQRVVLHNISWDTYERLLAAHAGSSSPRFTYVGGELEVMSPLPVHERLNRAVQLLVPLVASQIGVRVYSLGSMTFRRQDVQQGFDPDSCFYIQNLQWVRGKDTLDLTVDPPPDLVVEIDITSPSLPRLPIYAEFRVPEIWRYDSSWCHILVLGDDGYVDAGESRALPGVTAEALSRLLGACIWQDDAELISSVSEWASTLRGPDGG